MLWPAYLVMLIIFVKSMDNDDIYIEICCMIAIWVKVFKNGPSKVCGRQLYHFNFFKGCLPNILLGPAYICCMKATKDTILHCPLIEAAIKCALQEKVILEILQNSQENTCARVSFLITLQASVCNFI